MSSRVEPSQADQQQQIDDLLELERRRALQGDDTRAQQELAMRRADDARTTGDDRSARAVTQAGDQQSRGAEWTSFADRSQTSVPQSVQDIHDQARKIEESNNANQAAKDDTNRQALQREMQQRMTIAEIQAEATKKSGMIRG